MLRFVMGAAAALFLLAGPANAAPVPAPVQSDFEFDQLFTGGPGGNICGTGGLAGCEYNGSPAIIKFEFNDSGAITGEEINPLFTSISGDEFSFTFSNGTGSGRWTYTPDDATDPGITAFAAKGSNAANIFVKQSQAFANTIDFSDYTTPIAGRSGKVAGLSNMVFFDSMTPVPVPAALPLFGTALAGLAYWRRRGRA